MLQIRFLSERIGYIFRDGTRTPPTDPIQSDLGTNDGVEGISVPARLIYIPAYPRGRDAITC